MANNESFAQFLNYILNDIREKSSYIKDADNVIIGESLSMLDKPDSFFPRAELLISKQKYNGWLDQRMLNQSFRFSIGAHLRREHDNTTEEDMFDALNWGQELMNTIYNMHETAIQDGPNTICDGFIQISGYPEIFCEYELFPRITTVILVAEAEIQLLDTYTNN
jgi:hypothetical protein